MSLATPEGALIAAGLHGIEGWAWDPLRPYEAVEVELISNGTVLARAVADQFDMELVHQRIGNGMHAFRIQLDKLPDGPYPLSVGARIVGGPEIGGHIKFESPAELKGVVVELAFHDYEGIVDGIRDGKISGWAWNRCLPDEPPIISLYDGSIHVGDTLAGDYRDDLAKAGKGSGYCGFSIDLPLNMLDGEMHSLNVRVHGSSYQLMNSPLAFGPSSARSFIDFVVQLRQDMDSLSKTVKEIVDKDKALTKSTLDDLKSQVDGASAKSVVDHLMQRTEALLTIQREALEREMRVLVASPLPDPPAKAFGRHGRKASVS